MPPKISVKLGTKGKKAQDTPAKAQQVTARLVVGSNELGGPEPQLAVLLQGLESPAKRARRVNSRKRFREEEGYEEAVAEVPPLVSVQSSFDLITSR